MILRQAGYNVVAVAHDGVEAVEMAHSMGPDLILMDIKMPRMDGLEAARAINKDRTSSFAPIVLVTAYADQALVRKAVWVCAASEARQVSSRAPLL